MIRISSLPEGVRQDVEVAVYGRALRPDENRRTSQETIPTSAENTASSHVHRFLGQLAATTTPKSPVNQN